MRNQIKVNTRNIPKSFQRSDLLKKYYNDISSYPILDPNEEVELFNSYRDGDMKSRDKIIQSNQRFVVAVAKKFAFTDIELMDMISEGNIGLMTAVEKFDTTYGFRFISYAVNWIYSHISRYIAKKPLIHKRIDPQLQKRIREVEKILAKEETDINNGTIKRKLEEMFNIIVNESDLSNSSSISIDIPADDEQYTSCINEFNGVYSSCNDIVNIIDNDYNKYLVKRYLGCLTDKEQTIVKMYHGIDHDNTYSFYDIGNELGIPHHRANGHYNKSIQKMRNAFRRRGKR